MLSALDLSPQLLEALAELACTAGREIERYRAAGFGSRFKDDGSLVTEADKAAEAVILDGLERIAPGVPIVSEEQASDGEDPACEGRFFLVDPLDGTRDFVESDLGEYAVNIALVDAGRPTLGVIYAPAHDLLFAGGPGGAWQRVQGQRSPLRPAQTGKGAFRAITSRRSKSRQLDRFLAEVAKGERTYGSSSIKFTKLAAGQSDLYPRFTPVSEWDVAAGEALLRAIGGGVVGLDGAPLRYGQRRQRYQVPGFIAYADAMAHAAAMRALQPAT